MKLSFDIKEKTFTNDEGKEIKYMVLYKKLVTGRDIEIPIKKEKLELLLMNEQLEKTK